MPPRRGGHWATRSIPNTRYRRLTAWLLRHEGSPTRPHGGIRNLATLTRRPGSHLAVTIKEPGLSNGYIHFTMLGAIDRQRGGVFDAGKDENSVVFTRRHLAEFLAIKAHVEARMVRGPMGSSAPAATTRLEQLKQLGELRDSGVLTAEEFELEKQKLLAGS